VLNVLTLQQGPGEIVVAAKLKFRSGMDTDTLVEAINSFERPITLTGRRACRVAAGSRRAW